MSSHLVRINAHAKINLHLAIGGRRADGYHDVETVLQTLALHDTLTCEAYDGPFTLRCDVPGVPLDATNLVWRAAALLAEAAGLGAPAHARVTIEKRIPMQAGLGGGSADAAAALLGLARLWQLDIDRRVLRDLGARLGADVPFFFEGGTALGLGRGDELHPLADFPSSAVLVVMPPFGVSTADAYRWHDERVAAAGAGREVAARPGTAGAALPWPERSAQWREWLPRCVNDFETVVGARLPAVPEAIGRLKAAGASLAAMSGSGAALFGLFETPSAAESAAGYFNFAGWRTFVSQTMDRLSYSEKQTDTGQSCR